MKMNEEELRYKLLCDLSVLNLPVDEVDVYLRPYSKTYYGNYFPVYNDKNRPKIYLYPYEEDGVSFMNYEKILETAIHEFCHHVQYNSGSFVRKRGVMHDTQFWKLYNHYIKRAKKNLMIGGARCEEAVI